MNNILLFFVLPISIILLSIVLQKVLKCPTLVAITFFAILFIVTYLIDPSLLIFAIAYTVLSYITAVLTRLICNIKSRIGSITNDCDNNKNCICNDNHSTTCSGLNIRVREGNNQNNCNPTRFSVTTNQENPVLYLSNQNCNQPRRNNCCCGRR